MMQHMKNPPTRVRVTVPVTPETLEAFQFYADMAGMSVGRAMGEWLQQQLAAVQYAALKFEEVHAIPRDIADKVQAQGGAPDRGGDPEPAPPRPVIRGGNYPVKTLRSAK